SGSTAVVGFCAAVKPMFKFNPDLVLRVMLPIQVSTNFRSVSDLLRVVHVVVGV
ncbi:hypothetical protein A2U01_0110619, partial [Trifolium medium]|nr:hypothetical protein [Trifolium medium]